MNKLVAVLLTIFLGIAHAGSFGDIKLCDDPKLLHLLAQGILEKNHLTSDLSFNFDDFSTLKSSSNYQGIICQATLQIINPKENVLVDTVKIRYEFKKNKMSDSYQLTFEPRRSTNQ